MPPRSTVKIAPSYLCDQSLGDVLARRAYTSLVVVVVAARLLGLVRREVAEVRHLAPLGRIFFQAADPLRRVAAVDAQHVRPELAPRDRELVVRQRPVRVRRVLVAREVVEAVSAELDLEAAVRVVERPGRAAAVRREELRLRRRERPDAAHAAPVVGARRAAGRGDARAGKLAEHAIRHVKLVVAVLTPRDGDRRVGPGQRAPPRRRGEARSVEDAAGPQTHLELAAGVLERVPAGVHGVIVALRPVHVHDVREFWGEARRGEVGGHRGSCACVSATPGARERKALRHASTRC